MAVIALTSASGSPGVTTTAIGLALQWPRPVLLVDADPTGGSGLLAGYFRGTQPYVAGLIELALTSNSIHDGLAEVSQRIDGTQVSFVAGTRSHTQAPALRDLWRPLADELADLEGTGHDVIVDAGRLGLVGSPEPLLANADLTLIVTRTTLPALAGVRSWADSVQRGTSEAMVDWQQPGVLVVGEGRPYGSREVAGVLGLSVVATLADDPESAAVFSRGATAPKRFETGPLARGLQAAIAAIHSTVSHHRDQLLEGART
jgi:MinD-like ATPase involved in chromosome partitioning or flagellar assembly